MKISDQVVFVTGANRGIGRAFVSELLIRGVGKVYAGVRDPHAVDQQLAGDPRVEVVRLDVTDPDEVARAAAAATDTSILVNNAGIVTFESLLDGSVAEMRRQFETNVFGVLEMTRAFAPTVRARRGAVVNVLSAAAWFSAPLNGAYCASKAAAWSITNGIRTELEPAGVLVQSLHFGAVDTDFSSGYDGPKITADDVARAALDGLASDAPEVLVDAHARMAKAALTGPPNGFLEHMRAGTGA
ncbi:short-chain dehydrogenase [Mycolicibacterium arabiense]|uniref:Short-chain dehydrogenase n=1 Tax=Mycolicibacterium arabiense TaxID=1286181 RepID=A0A7I7RWY2_9MYCO|nr:SDR family oxidoreductase [Mycolicibacterium arabiense]MCV7375369.1 SDR family oxidoreductase [Mycolicibacterium arabiense]BBY48516.1 short-chain dehydrogenase [Mycolicibacterium arabiense]